MKIKYQGDWVNLNVNELIKAPIETKKEFIAGQINYIAKRFKDYWIGYVNVRTQDIYCCSANPDKKGIHKLYEVNITTGRKKSGQMFNSIGKDICQQLVDNWGSSDKKIFTFHLDLGCGMSQSYTFTKKQKNMLIEQLKPLLDKEWYVDGDCEW